MTIKNRGIQRFMGIALFVASCGFMAGCSQIDVNNEDGLREALQTRQKLDKAVMRVQGMITNPDNLKPFVPDLVKLYLDGSSYDREIIQVLAVSKHPAAYKALEKAVDSKDYKQVMQAAIGIKELQSVEERDESTANSILNKLLAIYDKQVNPEVQRVILEAGSVIQNDSITQKAVDILKGNVDETPFNLLRASCDILAFQKDPSTVNTLMTVVYHQDGVGHTLTTNCTRALLSLEKSVVAPVMLKAFNQEIPELKKYIEEHPDTLTEDSVRNNTANVLALYRYADAVEPMLSYLGNTRTIPVPGTLAIRPAGDPQWVMWASLVGVAAQSTLFALNDIGVRNNDRAKTILKDIFNWTVPYQSKFKNAIELTGTTNIEVSQRVNAFRTLRENDLLSDDELAEMIESLKNEEFNDESKWRPYARASIGNDMVTYCAVTAKPGDLEKVWQKFSDFKNVDGIFYVKPPENPDAPKVAHYNDGVNQRIEDVKPAFELAKECDNAAACYADKIGNLKDFALVKAIYELGLTGDPKYFDVVANAYVKLDAWGQLYGTKALAQLGDKSKVDDVQALIKKLSREMPQMQFTTAKPSLEGLITTLSSK